MADNQDALIQSFCDVTGADPQSARHLLEASNWDLQIATEQFYEGGDDDDVADQMDEDEDEAFARAPSQPAAAAASSDKSKSKAKGSGGAKIRTLGDLSTNDEEEEEEDEKPQDFFAGGEKSGLAVQNPGEASARKGGDLIQDILKRAAEGGQRRRQEEQEAPPPRRFTGSGHTLGNEDNDSVEVPDPNASAPRPRASVIRTLTFWRDGFSVEDGPLMRYDDPANREILQAIENGRAPLSLMNVEPGQPADVNVFKRLDEDYIPPKKKFVPFSGQGQRLGSIQPGEPSTSAAPAAAPAAVAAPAVAPTHAPTASNVDESAPTTNLQIRLGDGTRLVRRFNHTHTVADVYSFVNASSAASRGRNYVLQTTFPTVELKDMDKTLKDVKLINAVVVQKWVS